MEQNHNPQSVPYHQYRCVSRAYVRWQVKMKSEWSCPTLVATSTHVAQHGLHHVASITHAALHHVAHHGLHHAAHHGLHVSRLGATKTCVASTLASSPGIGTGRLRIYT